MSLHPNRLKWLKVILFERFGLPLEIYQEGDDSIILKLNGNENSIVFDKLSDNYLSTLQVSYSDFLPEGFCSLSKKHEFLPAPGLSGNFPEYYKSTKNGIAIHYDIPGFVAWMLSREEELDVAQLDSHGRVPAKTSQACINDYLDRPVVDEWLTVLSCFIERMWPDATLKKHMFKMDVSHDVDYPSRYALCGPAYYLRSLAEDILVNKDFTGVIHSPKMYFSSTDSLSGRDKYNTFNWLMDLSEELGIKSSFYFMSGKTHAKFDPGYDLDHPVINRLLLDINERGHEIGLHPSYNSYLDRQTIINEAKKLSSKCKSIGIKQDIRGGRMHYLRWKTPDTLYGWEEAGMAYINTHGYADIAGFRCGTCFDYPAYDPVNERQLDLRIRPLIAMDASVLSPRYMNCAGEDAFKIFKNLKDACRDVNGSFSLLWHNSMLTTNNLKELYKTILYDSD